MAWPSTPLTTYVAGTPPAIKAADLNELQDGVNQIINGSYTVKGLYLDGTGGASTTPKEGALRLAGFCTETAIPGVAPYTGTALAAVGTVDRGWAVVNGNATVVRHFNCYDVARTVGQPTGAYTITFHATPSDFNGACGWASLVDNGTAGMIGWVAYNDGTGKLALDVRTYDKTGTLDNRKFSCGFKAE